MHVTPISFARPPFLARAGGDGRRAIALWTLPSMALAVCVALPSGVQWSYASLLLLVLAPTLEEIVFRGGLQEGLLRRLGDSRAATANLLTATLFAAAHVALRPTLVSLLTLLPALAIGVIYQRHRRIVPCIALHIVFNGIWLQWVVLSVSS